MQPEQVVHHNVVNFSSAQHQFSFSKTRRFNEKHPVVTTDFKYEPRSSFTKQRSPTFGYGERFKRPKHTLETPPPNSYEIKTSFDGPNPVIRKNAITTSFK